MQILKSISGVAVTWPGIIVMACVGMLAGVVEFFIIGAVVSFLASCGALVMTGNDHEHSDLPIVLVLMSGLFVVAAMISIMVLGMPARFY